MATKPAKPAPPAAPVGGQAFGFSDGQLHALETRCNEVSKGNGGGVQYFMGQTSDQDGNFGAALIATDDVSTVKHFGTFRQLMAILNQEHA